MSHAEQSGRSTVHSTFVIERTYAAPPRLVFDAWADPAAKTKWFGPPEKPEGAYSLEFREGGHEHLSMATPGNGPVYTYDARYQDIVPGKRTVYAYDMHQDEDRISVSLATVEIDAAGEGTRLTLTEHGVFLDGHDTPAQREHGTNALIDALGAHLDGGVVRGPESS
ncbi:MAG: SRPBCC family protein [Solirubrobacteraceae bacterium]